MEKNQIHSDLQSLFSYRPQKTYRTDHSMFITFPKIPYCKHPNQSSKKKVVTVTLAPPLEECIEKWKKTGISPSLVKEAYTTTLRKAHFFINSLYFSGCNTITEKELKKLLRLKRKQTMPKVLRKALKKRRTK